jgi:hypothetical protein
MVYSFGIASEDVRATKSESQDEVAKVVPSPLHIQVFRLPECGVQRKVFVALGSRHFLEFLPCPVTSCRRFNFGQYAKPIEGAGFELFDSDIK